MVMIVAEIASAHEGKLEQMLQLVDAAKASNADAVKFQIYKADLLSVQSYPFYNLYKQLEYDENKWEQIISYAHELQLPVLAEVSDPWGLQLARKCGAEGYKIHSTVFYEEELMAKIASTGKPVYLGVGGIPLAKIDNALEILSKSGAKKVILIHGFQSYPTRLEDTDLLRIVALKERFKLPVCFADHVDADSQLAVILPLVAIGCGVDVIEKHLTLDRSRKGLDYFSALNPAEFSSMVNSIREVEKALGTGDLSGQAERKYLISVVKKIVATEQIKAGEFITPEKIAFKRSEGEGLLPTDKQRILYKKAKKNIENLKNLGFDVIGIRPNPIVMKKLIKRDFYKYLNPVKITEYSLWSSTYIIAHAFRIPLIIQGENPGLTLGVRKTGVGVDGDALKANELNTLSSGWEEYLDEGLTERDLFLFHYDGGQLRKEGIRGIWLQYYVKKWSQSGNAEFSIAHGLTIRPEYFNPYEHGTYGAYYQMDGSILEVNQMLKYIKFGFGQCTDHACYDIRAGRLTREEAIELVKRYDGKCGVRYIKKFCDYIGITMDEFWRVANSFRGDMWTKDENGNWILKDTL